MDKTINTTAPLSKLIIQRILSYIIKHSEPFETYRKNSQPNQYNESASMTGLYTDLNKLSINYILVCKEWLQLISSTFYNRICLDNGEFIDFGPYSVFQNEYITYVYLYIWKDNIRVKPSLILERFPNLQRVVFGRSSGEPEYIRELVSSFAPKNILLEVFFDTSDLPKGDISDLDESVLEYTFLYTNSFMDDFDVEEIDSFYEQYVKRLRLGGIDLDYVDNYDEDAYSLHVPYRNMLKYKHLKDIKIRSDFVDLKDLAFAMQESHIESLYVIIPFGVLKDDETDISKTKPKNQIKSSGKAGDADADKEKEEEENEGDDEEEKEEEEEDEEENDDGDDDDEQARCNCIPNGEDKVKNLYSSNQLSHWKEFCHLLGNDRVLKKLELKNHCLVHSMDQVVKEQASSFFADAISINSTLEELSISGKVLTDSFYNKMSINENRSIHYLCVRDLDNEDIPSICNVIKSNISIVNLFLDSEFGDIEETMTEQLHESLFINQTIVKLILQCDSFFGLVNILTEKYSDILSFRYFDSYVEIQNINFLTKK